MYLNNGGGGGGGGAGSSAANSANMQPFQSPYFDQLNLGSMTLDFPSRQLSPGMASGRLGYTPLNSGQGLLSTPMLFPARVGTPPQQHLGMGAPPPMPKSSEDLVEVQKAKNAMMVTSRLANLERNKEKKPPTSSSSAALPLPTPPVRTSSSNSASSISDGTTSIYAKSALGLVNNLVGYPQPSSASNTSTLQHRGNSSSASTRGKSAAAAAASSSSMNPMMSNSNIPRGGGSTNSKTLYDVNKAAGNNNNKMMQQHSSSGDQLGGSSSYLGNTSFFGDSPMMSNGSMMDLQTRLSPPSSTSFLNMPLPETPTNTGNKMSLDAGVSLDHKLKRSAAVVSKLMNAERQVQSQRETKRNDDSPVLGNVPSNSQQQQQRLFAPLDNNNNNARQASQQQLAPNNNNGQQQQQPGPMTNMLRSARLSSSAGAGAEEGFFDMNFGNDFAYQFSPSEMSRSLGGAPIPESPLTQNLRLFPSYSTTGYNPMVPQGTPSWPQFPHASQYPPNSHPLASQGYPGGSGELALPTSMHHQQQMHHQHHQQQQQQQLHKGKGAKRRAHRGDSDSEDSDEDHEDDGGRPRKKKKTSKPVDPNEPKITSKHRGVCWYKRTKKWVVQTKVNGKRVHVGYFDDEEKAAEAYKNAVQGIQIKKALEAKKSLEDAAAAGQTGANNYD